MISVEEALARILAGILPLPAETVSLPEALGRVLAEELIARVSQPPADVSAMDGYAVRAADLSPANLPARLRVIGESAAGKGFDDSLGAGEAVRIFTGAPLPDGSDSIVIQEDVNRDGDWVEMSQEVTLGNFVRPEGLDFRKGVQGLPEGQLMGARHIGLAAAMNRPWVKVRRRPQVTIIANGDELVMPGDPLGPDQILSSNTLALAAYLKAIGADPLPLGIAPDDREAIARLLEGARRSDLILITGGASVGDRDLVHSALQDKNVALDFWRIAMRPGKPLIFGHFGDTPLIGLPGNPVSNIVCATVFVRAAVNAMLGLPPEPKVLPTARLLAPLPKNDRRQDYLRANLHLAADGTQEVMPFSRQDSAMLRTLTQADCLIVRPPFADALEAGARVPLLLLTGGAVGT
ncbi:MAG TPA: gephyrin-like molybdotransferase Glp [Kiloniellaceae bacterium]|nr:gephyrin-like molybdotransferase Glp [Kiloniellaceae bacterium]